MTMFNYLTIEQAIKYVSSKINYEFSYENLKDLEAFQIIQPVFFFQGFAKFHYMEDKEAITEIGGYFQLYEGESLISKEDINFDKCFLYQPALDDYDTFDGEIEICLNLEEQVRVEDGYEVIPSLKWIKDSHVEINPYNYSFYLYDLDDNGNEFIKSAIKPYEVRIKKAELDDWLMTTIEGDKAQSLQTRISELEKQLEQSSQQLEQAKANQLPKGQGDTLLILGAVMESIRGVAKPNYTQTSLIDAILTKYGDTPGISYGTLTKKFPEAKDYLKQRLK